MVAGGETAGIPYAAWIADRLGLPMQYVRKKPKGFGRNAQIEGDMREGARTLLVEDLTTDGALEDQFLPGAARRGRGGRARVRQLLLRHLSRVEEDMADLNVKLHYLATWWDVLAVVKKGGYLAGRADRRGGEVPARAGQVVGGARRRLQLSVLVLRVITLNVNGIRSAASKGFFRWLAGQRPDVVCLQEMKARRPTSTTKLRGLKGYQTCHAFAREEGLQRRRALQPQHARRGRPRLRHREFDAEGRYLEARLRQAVR